MKEYKKEITKMKDLINEKIEILQEVIRDNFVKNEYFDSAVNEIENESNDTFIIELANIFGNWIAKLTNTYVSPVLTTKSYDELVEEYNSELRLIIDEFKNKFSSDLDEFVISIVESIEKSDLFTEVVTNPSIGGRKARKEIANHDV